MKNITTVMDLTPAEVLALNALAFDLGLNRSIEPDYLTDHMEPDFTCPAGVVLPHHNRGWSEDIAHHRLGVRLDDGDLVLIDVPAEVWEWIVTGGCSTFTPLVERFCRLLRAEIMTGAA
ncbi:MAG: hypothetical protein M3510_01150 [Actinomycetota bacterium]|nr:hypothetical protein [Actinomycetota bacterium]